MAERSYRKLFWTLTLLGLLLDQGTKYYVFSWLHNGGHGDEYVVVPNVFEFMAQFQGSAEAATPRVNQGALFGFANSQGWIANAIFAAVSLAAAAAIMYWSSLRSTAHDAALCSSLGLILAGTLGNLYDRVIFRGVRDFIHWHYYTHEWPVFNIADCCLVCGAGLLLVQAFWARPVPVARENDEPVVSGMVEAK